VVLQESGRSRWTPVMVLGKLLLILLTRVVGHGGCRRQSVEHSVSGRGWSRCASVVV
jgi:hypothetical protein